jgi:putative ABC transport system ATP-binding protein
MISANNIVKSFGKGELELVVLKSISLEIADGEFVAIIGPSGAGKSTLLYQLSLLDEPNSGEISFNGRPMSGLSQADKTGVRLHEMGFVFQDYALLPELTAVENVSLPIIMQGLSKSAAAQKAGAALTRVGLADKLGNLPSQLSGGQQQRVSIARAIAHDPHILFADEPTANLDTASSRAVIESFLDLHRNGQTIIMVTHEQEYAQKAGRIIELRDGVIVSDRRN